MNNKPITKILIKLFKISILWAILIYLIFIGLFNLPLNILVWHELMNELYLINLILCVVLYLIFTIKK